MNKLALFGGTFNPIHNGHIYLLNQVDKVMDFDRIIVMPSKIPPHKSHENLISEYHRLNMCKLSFENNEKVTVSDFEMTREEKSYTIFTLRHLKEQHPDSKIFLLMGSDMLLSFHEWFEHEKILKLCVIVAVSRSENDSEKLAPYAKKIVEAGGRCKIVPVLPFEISSTEIRRKISQGEDVSCLLPKNTLQYILENNLYS